MKRFGRRIWLAIAASAMVAGIVLAASPAGAQTKGEDAAAALGIQVNLLFVILGAVLVIFIEDHHRVDARERLEDLGPLRLRDDRPARPLDEADGAVRIHANQQRVAKPPGLCQVAQVTDVEQIEHAVGEHDDLAGGAQLRDEAAGLLERHGASLVGLKTMFGVNVQRWRGR